MKYNSQWPENTSDMTEDITNAMNYIREALPMAQKDCSRPRYHFVPPAGTMVDTWGAVLHRGYYHLFYDINTDGKKERFVGSFAHIRSRDMLRWEQLPIALTPSEEKGELRCNDGCVVIDPSGRALMYYTSVFYDDGKKHREHTPVRGDDDLITWERIEEAMPITIKNHNGPFYKTGWSDPFIFSCRGRTFMLLSKCVTSDGENQIPIYEAVDDSWLNWEFRGIFFDDSGK